MIKQLSQTETTRLGGGINVQTAMTTAVGLFIGGVLDCMVLRAKKDLENKSDPKMPRSICTRLCAITFFLLSQCLTY